MTNPRCLAIALFYNDDDIAADHLRHMLDNNHDVVAWDHGSTDGTSAVLDQFKGELLGRHYLPREFDFYNVFEHVSRYVMDNLAAQYDWISFPESDEFLEGPDRTMSYYEHLCAVHDSAFDWIQFINMVYWFTDTDDMSIVSPRARVKHYSPWLDCPPRIYAWRAKAMNVRIFNHNEPLGRRLPVPWVTCHYQWRSEAQALKRIERVRGLRRGGSNVHFDNMTELEKLRIPSERLWLDDGGELKRSPLVDFRRLYGV